jgi:hypothetical protein
MRAKKAQIEVLDPIWREDDLHLEALRVPVSERRQARVLGRGPEAVPALVELLASLGVLS